MLIIKKLTSRFCNWECYWVNATNFVYIFTLFHTEILKTFVNFSWLRAFHQNYGANLRCWGPCVLWLVRGKPSRPIRMLEKSSRCLQTWTYPTFFGICLVLLCACDTLDTRELLVKRTLSSVVEYASTWKWKILIP